MTKQRRVTHKHSHVADMSQECADQSFVFTANVLLKRALQPVFDVAHLQHPAGVPANGQVMQRRSQHKVVPPQLTGGAEVEHIPQAGVQEDLTELETGERQTPPAVLVKEGEKVEETFMVELAEMHDEPSHDRERGLFNGVVIGPLVGSNNEPAASIVWPRYMMPPSAHAGGLHI